MSELRQQLQQARYEHVHVRYAGDLASDIKLRVVPHRARTWHALFGVAAVAAAVLLVVWLGSRTVTLPEPQLVQSEDVHPPDDSDASDGTYGFGSFAMVSMPQPSDVFAETRLDSSFSMVIPSFPSFSAMVAEEASNDSTTKEST